MCFNRVENKLSSVHRISYVTFFSVFIKLHYKTFNGILEKSVFRFISSVNVDMKLFMLGMLNVFRADQKASGYFTFNI